MAVTIRRALASDKSVCLQLIEVLTGRQVGAGGEGVFDALLTRERGAVLVAVADDRILGVATISYNLAVRYAGEYCQLEELIVDPDGRGQNAGGLLVAAAVAAARSRGCAEMGLYLVAHTEHNQPFYERYGFRKVGTEMRQPL